MVRGGRGVGRGLACAVVITGVALGAAAPPASASCASADLAALADAADVALVGTVTSVDDRLARIRVSDVWRGSSGSVVEVDGGSSAESVRWTVDAQYAVLADQHGSRLTTDVCAGTRPVDDATLRTLDAELGPATPLGRGAAPVDPTEPLASGPAATPGGDEGRLTPRAAQDDDAGLTTPQIALGLVLGLAVLASFLLPQLRRHHRERRAGLRDPDEPPPEPRDPRDSWR